jgi:prolipoprotein diacylglyceryltransferase
LLEAGLAGLVLIASIRVNGVFPFHGSLFFTSLASYGTGRWLLEPTRETIDRIGRVSLNRMISAGLVVLAAMAFLLLHISQITAAPPNR